MQFIGATAYLRHLYPPICESFELERTQVRLVEKRLDFSDRTYIFFP